MRLPRIEMIFAFLPLHLIQYNVEGKNFLVEAKDDNTRRAPSGLVCEYFVRCVCKIAQGQSKGRGPVKKQSGLWPNPPSDPPSRFGKGPDFLRFFSAHLPFSEMGLHFFNFTSMLQLFYFLVISGQASSSHSTSEFFGSQIGTRWHFLVSRTQCQDELRNQCKSWVKVVVILK